MITLKSVAWQSEDWSRQLAAAVTDLDTLLGALELTRSDLALDDAPDFPLRVPRPFIRRMRIGDPNDPLLRQVLPVAAEREVREGFVSDPLSERDAARGTGIIQKYAGRVLLIAAPSCAVHCRYCFRRHFPYDEHQSDQRFPDLDAIASDATIQEVILSGGDPLMLKDAALARLVTRLEAMPHLTRLRIHTRLPVVIPARMTAALLERLAASHLATSIVVHVNHPNELDGALERALRSVPDHGIALLNQSVLLRGVNDDADVLTALSERLFSCGALPYYLHLPDAVAGTGHFSVSAEEGRALVAKLAARLSGYLVPRLAREIAGADAKQVLAGS